MSLGMQKVLETIEALPIDTLEHTVSVEVEPTGTLNFVELFANRINSELRDRQSAYRVADFSIARELGQRKVTWVLKLRLIGVAELGAVRPDPFPF